MRASRAFIVDLKVEHIAVRKSLENTIVLWWIQTVTLKMWTIPFGNDDAIRAIKLMSSIIATP